MSERNLAAFIGIAFVVSNFLTIFLVIALYALRGFTFEEMTTTIAIIIPVFAAHTTTIVKFAAKHRDVNNVAHQENRQTFLFTFISIFVTTMLIIAVIGLVFMRAFNIGLTTFEQFKIMLGGIEAVFAGYAGLVVSALFGPEKPAPKLRSSGRLKDA
jgi:hypothetical protein